MHDLPQSAARHALSQVLNALCDDHAMTRLWGILESAERGSAPLAELDSIANMLSI
jgi:hypothetical protein